MRECWSSKIGFIMASVGSAVGLGLLWKLPYVAAHNGGGLFFFTYLIALFCLGLPLFRAEVVIGKETQKASIRAFNPRWKWIGVVHVIVSFLIMSFYSVAAGWGLSYLFFSMMGGYHSMQPDKVASLFKLSVASPLLSLLWHFVFTLFTFLVVHKGVQKGIERCSKILMRFLVVLLLGFVLYNTQLEGFSKAVRFLFLVQPQQFSYTSVIEAVGLAFFTLSCGQGVMVSYGSYLKKDGDVVFLSRIVTLSVFVIAILASLVIFPLVFTFDVPLNSGFGLVFETLPRLFAHLPSGEFLSIVFFSLFTFTALTSSVPLIEVVSSNLMEVCAWKRSKAVMVSCLGTFIVGIASCYSLAWMGAVDQLVSVWLIPLCGFGTIVYTAIPIFKKNIASV